MNGSDDRANDPSLRGNENVVVDVNLSVNLDVRANVNVNMNLLRPWPFHVRRVRSRVPAPYLLIASTAVLTSILGAEIPFVSVIGRPDVLSAASS